MPATRTTNVLVDPHPPVTSRPVLVPVMLALPGALLLGGLTSYGQGYLPSWLSSLANSAGGWTLVAFGLVWLGGARPALGAVLGLVAFQALNEGYGLVSDWRGFFYAAPFSGIWTLVGLLAGPLVGFAGSLRRRGRPLWRLLAVTPLAAVLLGEGAWALTAVADTTSPVYWWLEIALAVVLVGVAVAGAPVSWAQRALAVGVWLLGSAAYVGLVVLVLA